MKYTEKQYIGLFWWAIIEFLMIVILLFILIDRDYEYTKQVKFANKKLDDLVKQGYCTNFVDKNRLELYDKIFMYLDAKYPDIYSEAYEAAKGVFVIETNLLRSNIKDLKIIYK